MSNLPELITAMDEALFRWCDPSNESDAIALVPEEGRTAWLLVIASGPRSLQDYLALPAELQVWVRRWRYGWLPNPIEHKRVDGLRHPAVDRELDRFKREHLAREGRLPTANELSTLEGRWTRMTKQSMNARLA